MTVLIHQAFINDPGSSFHGKKMDLLISNGVIQDIQPTIEAKADQIIKGESLYVSPGWVDVFANFADPGYEHKETLESGARAAATGGFTDVFVIPNTRPVIDSKSQVEYIRHRSAALPVNIHPIGAVSRAAEGHDLAEMYDMKTSGAVAFSDGLHPVQSSGLLVKALQYVKAFDGVVIQIPDDKSIAPHGLMHEGIQSTRFGLAGKPILAEELLVARDIKLARYAGSRLHFTGITSPKSLEYIRRAKEAGIAITCSVTPYHLFFSDEDLGTYDTNLKVYPPLRTPSAIEALKAAVADGTVDCIATHHLPHETDSKVTEFEYAAFGMIGLETCYAALKTAMPQLSESRVAELLSLKPREIFGLPQPRIEKNQAAVVTIYDAAQPTTISLSSFASRSRNSAYLGKTLMGTVKGMINKGSAFLNIKN
jgi:dihydroorotase